jgi:predicted sulfurtransferase
MCADGDRGSAEAADLLQAAGYSAVMQMEGGYAGYSKVRPGSWCDRCAVLFVLLDSLVCAA